MALLRFWRTARSPSNASDLPPSQRGADTLSRRNQSDRGSVEHTFIR